MRCFLTFLFHPLGFSLYSSRGITLCLIFFLKFPWKAQVHTRLSLGPFLAKKDVATITHALVTSRRELLQCSLCGSAFGDSMEVTACAECCGMHAGRSQYIATYCSHFKGVALCAAYNLPYPIPSTGFNL